MARRRDGLGLLVAAQGPAVVGSGLIVGGVGYGFGWIGTTVALLGWIALGLGALSTAGEREVVITLLGWEPIDLDEAVGFDATARLERVTGLSLAGFSFYLAAGWEGPNAYATGGRSVGLTPDFVAASNGPEAALDPDEVVAILTHEVGHHQGRYMRGSAMVTFLRRPYDLVRLWSTAVLRDVVQTNPLAGLLLCAGLLLSPLILWVISPTLFVCGVAVAVLLFGVLPLLGGVLSRAEECRADEYAIECGQGTALINGLQRFEEAPLTWWQQMTASHPRIPARCAHIEAELSARGT